MGGVGGWVGGGGGYKRRVQNARRPPLSLSAQPAQNAWNPERRKPTPFATYAISPEHMGPAPYAKCAISPEHIESRMLETRILTMRSGVNTMPRMREFARRIHARIPNHHNRVMRKNYSDRETAMSDSPFRPDRIHAEGQGAIRG